MSQRCLSSRRNFLLLSGAAPFVPLFGAAAKPLRGIFPIMQTPFTEADKVDLPVLAKQVGFLDRCGVHGVVWPQLASEYAALTREERLAGAEAILAAARGTRPAVVIGVQADESAQAIEYARHAAKTGADALIALPPRNVEDENRIFTYYQAIGGATPLPLFIQAVGKMSVEFVVRMAKEIPTLRYIKDEAGPVHSRITEFRRLATELNAFTGNHGRTLYEEMLRGSAGTMPAAGFGDLYASAWDLYHDGKRRESAEFCARALLLISEMETWGIPALKYVLHLRGVFPNWRARGGGVARGGEFDDYARQAIGEMLETMGPFLRT